MRPKRVKIKMGALKDSVEWPVDRFGGMISGQALGNVGNQA